jgi:hypothetical protein
MGGFRVEGNTSGNVAEVTASNELKVILPTGSTPASVGGVRMFSENDAGTISGTPTLLSPETDFDYRLRISSDLIMDSETFNYTAQNTGKHSYTTNTMTAGWTAAGLTTNASSITTTTTSATVTTYAEFPMLGSTSIYCEMEAAFSAQPVSNTTIDFGMFRRPTAHPAAPTDGMYFRLTAAGFFGIVNQNGTETSTPVFTFSYTNSKVYQFLITAHERQVQFWINGNLYGTINTPDANGQPFLSAALPFSVRHAIVGGAAGGIMQFILRDYTVSIGGAGFSTNPSAAGNRIFGSYQGLSGGAMGSLATYANSSNPTAAAPANGSLTANLPAGLGGQGAVTAAVAAATDGIWGSYQVPAGTAAVQGKRLSLRGIVVDAVNIGAAVATTATTIQFSLAFGHTNVNLGTGEAVAAKAPRRVALGYMTWPVGAAIGQGPQAGPINISFGDSPIFVNPGEFVALVGKFIVGTATASQVISFTWQPIYGWE